MYAYKSRSSVPGDNNNNHKEAVEVDCEHGWTTEVCGAQGSSLGLPPVCIEEGTVGVPAALQLRFVSALAERGPKLISREGTHNSPGVRH